MFTKGSPEKYTKFGRLNKLKKKKKKEPDATKSKHSLIQWSPVWRPKLKLLKLKSTIQGPS